MAFPGTWAWPDVWFVPSAVAAAFLFGFNLRVWQRRSPPGLWPILAFSVGGSLAFAVGNLAGFLADDLPTYEACLLVIYLGLLTAVPSYLVLSLRFAAAHGHPLRWGAAPWGRIGAIWAAVVWLVLVTNPSHGLFLEARLHGPSEYHVLWYFYTASAYAMVLTAFGIYVWLALRGAARETRRAGLIMAIAVGFLLLGNALYIAWPTPLPTDTTLLGLCASCALLLIGTYRRDLALDALTATELIRRQSDSVLLVDRAGRLLYRNPAAESWLGDSLTPGESVFGALAQAFVQRESVEQPLTAESLEADLMEESQPREGHLFRLEGDERWGRLESTPFRDESGRVEGRSLRLRDETALQRLMDATADQVSMLETVLASTNEGILVVVSGAVQLANPQFYEIWGLPAELRSERNTETLARACLALVEEPERSHALLAEFSEGPDHSLRDEVALKGGRVLDVVSLPLARKARRIGRVLRVRDVTEHRRSEEALRQAQKLEGLAVMAGGIAHDFNNLLVSVLGNASLARMELETSAEADGFLSDIELAAERASELTRQLLAYAGETRIETAPLDLSELVGEVADLARASVSRAVEIRCRLAPGLGAVTGDAAQLRQVVMNLVLNAADAIGEDLGEGEVTLTTRGETFTAAPDGLHEIPTWRPGRYVVLEVKDTGCGMDEALLSRIFDPFFTTKFTGRGLGLAATLGIVRSHRGYVRVESEPGAGSTFTLLLPSGREEAPGSDRRGRPQRAEPVDATALVVDDDPTVAAVARRILESAGLRVCVAHSGADALSLYREDPAHIDVVLMDLVMPGMSGEVAAQKLAEIDPSVRVLFSSGHPEQELHDRLRDSESAHFIQKPYRRDALMAKLFEVMRSR